jgi:hypothetical protein
MRSAHEKRDVWNRPYLIIIPDTIDYIEYNFAEPKNAWCSAYKNTTFLKFLYYL